MIMRCINCDVDTRRLRGHITSSLPNALLIILAGWLAIEVSHLIVERNYCTFNKCDKYNCKATCRLLSTVHLIL